MDEAQIQRYAQAAPGFLDHGEGMVLHRAALGAPPGPLLEIGSYCGRSAVYLGAAAGRRGGILYSLDHHRGSEEHQPGESYHDPSLLDGAGRVDTLPALRCTLAASGLEDQVVIVVGRSETVAASWATPLALLFIDGGHSERQTWADYELWAPKLLPGGLLAIHDVYPDLGDGNGRAPLHAFQHAIAAGWVEFEAAGSLRILKR